MQKPLVHNITNYVVMNWSANGLLAIGASPLMAHAIDEMQAMVMLAEALVVNIGTLDRAWIDSMKLAMKCAKALGRPTVLDPAGAGATAFRNQTCRELLLTHSPTVIRGNASEILALTGEHYDPAGVDSKHRAEDALPVAQEFAHQTHSVICISGETDYVVSESGEIIRLANGHPTMSQVTGMGCLASAMIGAFLAVTDSPLQATAAAMIVTGIAGEIAAEKSGGPGSFQAHYLDALFHLDARTIQSRQRILN